jgi:hypothetical protein
MDLRKKQSIPPVASASARAVTTRTPLNKDALIISSFFLLYIRIKGHYINTRIGYDDDQVKYNLLLYSIEKEDDGRIIIKVVVVVVVVVSLYFPR